MASLHQAIARLKRQRSLALGSPASIRALYSGFPVAPRGSLKALLHTLLTADLTETKRFSQPVVTGTALGGEVTMTLRSDGTGRFSGHMRATGGLSFQFRLLVVVRSASGGIAVMAQKSGEVFGLDTPGNRQVDWDEPLSFPAIAGQWDDLQAGTMEVTRSSELGGIAGGLVEVLGDVLEFVTTAALLSPVPGGGALAGIVFVGSELGALTDVRVLGPGGLPGIATAGGVAFLVGPHMIIPAFIAGVLVADLAIDHRRLNDSEKNFARNVFGDTLPFDRIILTNLSGENGQEFVTPSADGSILVNLGIGYANPETRVDPPRGYSVNGQILIHELTHAWQISHNAFASEIFWDAALERVEGPSAYRYGPPGPDWSSFGLEQQATIVDEWFAGTNSRAATPISGRRAMDTADPYFRYIANNLRLGQP